MCDLCAHRWLFVVSTGGRTGSTTLVDMLSSHPKIHLAGEDAHFLRTVSARLREHECHRGWHDVLAEHRQQVEPHARKEHSRDPSRADTVRPAAVVRRHCDPSPDDAECRDRLQRDTMDRVPLFVRGPRVSFRGGKVPRARPRADEEFAVCDDAVSVQQVHLQLAAQLHGASARGCATRATPQLTQL
eukprot:6208648-Pleurochrysis_carterae.AAC.1